MKRVAEIIYIIEKERAAFLESALHPSDEEKKVLWLCGVRKQQYFALNDLIFMTFEYVGDDFSKDMEKMANYLDTKGKLIQKRRKDVPLDERETTNWWAPVKKLGAVLETEPEFEEDLWDLECLGMLNEGMDGSSRYDDIGFAQEDWMDEIHI